MTVRIVTDSSCDLPQDVVAQYGISVVPLYINIGQKSYLDGIELSRQSFYEQLPEYKTPPTTSAPGPAAFVNVYEQLADEGATSVISVHISSSLSNTCNAAQLAAEATDAVPVTVIDSGQLTLGAGLLALAAAKAAEAGRSLAEIVDLLRDMAHRTYTFAALDTLEFLRRSGRLSHFQFGLGTLLSIKPLLKMYAGMVEMERVRTSRRSLERLIALASELGPLEHLSFVHTHAMEKVELLRQRVLHLLPGGAELFCTEVTPVIGSHIGPNAVGLICVAAREQLADT
ncbi:MAG: DegV family protein [Anaerolineae bacterium]|nr:DegV family protein [Anaerolineae bacterium]